MKKFSAFLVLWVLASIGFAQTKTFHDFTVVNIDGDTVKLSKYYGKKVLVVNTASACQYTYEYTPLQQLYNSYKKYGFEIVGFPCNDFGAQEQGTDSAISVFCSGKYGVTFQMMSKIAIVSKDTAPVYKWLQKKSENGVRSVGVTWNFNKFLIDEAGHWVKYYDSPVSPLDTGITNWIKSPSVIPPRKLVTSEEPLPTEKETILQGPAAELTGVKTYKSGEAEVVNVLVSEEMIKFRSANPAYVSMDVLVMQNFDRLEVQLYSADGRSVAIMHTGSATNNELLSYPVANLPNGIYYMNVIGDGRQKTIRCAVLK